MVAITRPSKGARKRPEEERARLRIRFLKRNPRLRSFNKELVVIQIVGLTEALSRWKLDA